MSTPSVPSRLSYSTDKQFYVDELRRMYNGKRLQTPDGYTVSFYLNRDSDCEHVICGKGKQSVNHDRARRIPCIEYMLFYPEVRELKINKKTRNICFVSRVCGCVLVCSVVRNKELKFVTFFYDGSKGKRYINEFDDRSKYTDV